MGCKNQRKKQDVFLFLIAPGVYLANCYGGALSHTMKGLGCEAHHPSSSAIVVKNALSYISTHGSVLN
jgi:hypothetical protein